MKRSILLSIAAFTASISFAQNPIISAIYTPDPAPVVVGDEVYLFADHDEDDAIYFKMKDWLVFKTKDMVNWTYLGTQVNTATFEWAKQGDRAWAQQAVERNGKWYWYLCCNTADGKDALCVAVADKPTGPWKDAIGGPLAIGFGYIDPTVFIDDDGKAYLFWGNKGFWYGELNDDMISFKNGYQEVPGYTDPKCFGELQSKMDWSIGKERMMTQYEEGPWISKHNGLYYATYPAGGVPEYMAYSTAPTVNGPWTFRGRIMDEAENSFTIHGGTINFKGHDYMFYHNGLLPNGGGFRRSTAIEEFKYNADGSIPFIPFTKEGVKPVDTLNPYEVVQAETMSSSWGVKLDRNAGDLHYVTSIHNGDWIKVRNVDFGDTAPTMVSMEMLNFKNEGSIEFYLDKLDGRPIATIPVNNDNMMITAPVRAKNATGIHDLYVLFRGGDEELFDLDWWKFNVHVNLPLIQTKYTADPAPMVYNDTIFLYTTHDEDESDGFNMKDWLLYTSTDMVNWTDHGAVASLKDFTYYDKDNGAWAEQVIERNGKFYMYCPIHGHGIGVLVADSPYGPFKDVNKEPLVWQKEHWYDIDPTVWIDEDGQAYMYWGNPHTYWCMLNEDMISIKGDIHMLDYHIEHYQEGPWLYKHDKHWYLAFASTCCPEGIGYAMSDSPTGPWKSMGHIMDRTWRTRGNHPGIIDYKGKSYVFGLNYELMHLDTFKHHERRSVSAAEMHYNADGSIEKVPYWQDNVLKQIEPFNPYRRVEAETMAWGYGLKTVEKESGAIYINNVNDGEHLKIAGVDFGTTGPKSIAYTLASITGGTIEIRVDSVDGDLLGTLKVKATGGDEKFKTVSTNLKKVTGVHDLFFVFHGEKGVDLFTLDYWKMK